MAENIKEIARNKNAYHECHILEKYEAEISLKGTVVKSIRLGRVNIRDSFAYIKDGEMFLESAHISPYEKGNINNVDPFRSRKLLMHKQEIRKLYQIVKERGYSIVVLKIYFKQNKVKAELGLAKGKKLYDKRQDIKEKDDNRKMLRIVKNQVKNEN